MSEVVERFLRYVKVDTQSDEVSGTHPSTSKQLDLARVLVSELEELGFSNTADAHTGLWYAFDAEHGYIYAHIPANAGADETLADEVAKAPKIGLIAHMDTSPEASGADVKPQIIEHYEGGDIVLGGTATSSEGTKVLRPADFPELLKYKGQTLLTSDGTTLLGADDKAGIAEIMTMVNIFLQHPEMAHGPIRVAFTPDEEIGEGTLFFDQKLFDADYAYTVDGGELGELSYENFNAASAKIHVIGRNVHPGEAYGKMIHAARLAMEIEARLPSSERPEKTRDHEGFYHLTEISGDASEATMHYILRDHDAGAFAKKKETVVEVCEALEAEYPGAKIEVEISDTYFNMIDKIKPHFEIVERAAEAMKRCGMEPRIEPIRGGTDGATLSYRGLLCPNLCAGGHNFHGVYEFISCQAMEQITELLVEILKIYKML